MQTDKFFYGVGMWIWEVDQCDGGNTQQIIARAKDNGLSYLIFKAVDGVSWFNPNFTQDLVDTIHRAGLKVYAWGYHYGVNLSEEIRLASVAMDLCDGYVLDVEAEFVGHADRADTLARSLRAHINDYANQHGVRKLLAYSTYGYPDYHKDFPFKQFNDQSDVFMPQMYFNEWNLSPVEGLNWAYGSWIDLNKSLGGGRPIIPVAPTYDHDFGGGNVYMMDGGKVTQIMQAVKGYGGINFWSYQHTKQDEWDAIRANSGIYPFIGFSYGNPAPAPTPQPTDNTLENLQSQLANEQAVNNVLKQQIGELTTQHQTDSTTIATLTQQISDLQTKLQAEDAIIQQLKTQLQAVTVPTPQPTPPSPVPPVVQNIPWWDMEISEFISYIIKKIWKPRA